jgi:hypothetical protein
MGLFMWVLFCASRDCNYKITCLSFLLTQEVLESKFYNVPGFRENPRLQLTFNNDTDGANFKDNTNH